jgi:hypothetical protein
VAKEDFKSMASAPHLHLLTVHNVGGLDIQPCPFGEAYVCFNCPLEHRRFLDGPTLQFDGYSVSFEKHDEGDNARDYDMDCEVWLLLVGYPLDARTTSSIAKAVSSFSMLRHVHESRVLSRIVIKVCTNSETQVPPSVVVGVGDGVVFGPGRSPFSFSLLPTRRFLVMKIAIRRWVCSTPSHPLLRLGWVLLGTIHL